MSTTNENPKENNEITADLADESEISSKSDSIFKADANGSYLKGLLKGASYEFRYPKKNYGTKDTPDWRTERHLPALFQIKNGQYNVMLTIDDAEALYFLLDSNLELISHLKKDRDRKIGSNQTVESRIADRAGKA